MHRPYRGVEQLEARRAHNPEVVGSSPTSATTKTAFVYAVFFLSVCVKREKIKTLWRCSTGCSTLYCIAVGRELAPAVYLRKHSKKAALISAALYICTPFLPATISFKACVKVL